MTEDTRYLDLADFLLLAEVVLGVSARELSFAADLGKTESALCAPSASFAGVESYPDFATKAAVLAFHLIKNHALPDGNKRVGFLALVEFCERNGFQWVSPEADDPDGDETVEVILAPSSTSARAFCRRVCSPQGATAAGSRSGCPIC